MSKYTTLDPVKIQKRNTITITRVEKDDYNITDEAQKDLIPISKSQIKELCDIKEYVTFRNKISQICSVTDYGDGDDWWDGYIETLELYDVYNQDKWFVPSSKCPLIQYAMGLFSADDVIYTLDEMLVSYYKKIIMILKHIYTQQK